jgi:hypothetical protein
MPSALVQIQANAMQNPFPAEPTGTLSRADHRLTRGDRCEQTENGIDIREKQVSVDDCSPAMLPTPPSLAHYTLFLSIALPVFILGLCVMFYGAFTHMNTGRLHFSVVLKNWLALKVEMEKQAVDEHRKN